MDVTAFVLSQLRPRARVLEVGCGSGGLARALDAAGHLVVAIDPAAPEGPLFRRIALEELDDGDDGRFDAVVAARSLHHVADLGAALARIARLLVPGGRLILDEFAWDRVDAATAEWFHGQQRALAAAGRGDAPPSVEAFRRNWEAEHAGLHGYDALRAELDARFDELSFEWRPYLHRYLEGVTGEALEQALIDAHAIRATGFRYVGTPRD